TDVPRFWAAEESPRQSKKAHTPAEKALAFLPRRRTGTPGGDSWKQRKGTEDEGTQRFCRGSWGLS
ncbi:MAG: hypothetical protein AAGU23_11290, partial [Bacillota bacterium]